MNQITKIEVNVLDQLLILLIQKGKLFSDDFESIKNNEFSKDDYRYLFEIFGVLGIAEIKPTISGRISIYSIPVKTDNFLKDDGFKRIYQEQQQELSKKKLQDKKFHWDFLNSKLGILSFIVSAISLIIAIIALLK
jgi:hypothetical protein